MDGSGGRTAALLTFTCECTKGWGENAVGGFVCVPSSPIRILPLELKILIWRASHTPVWRAQPRQSHEQGQLCLRALSFPLPPEFSDAGKVPRNLYILSYNIPGMLPETFIGKQKHGPDIS